MDPSRRASTLALSLLLAGAALAGACSSGDNAKAGDGGVAGAGGLGGAGGGVGDGTGGGPGGGDGGGAGGMGGAGGSSGGDGGAGCTTTISGSVYNPSGATPLANVLVFVPSGALAPFPAGPSCERCGGALPTAPIAETRSSDTGTFSLSVPGGGPTSLVVQTGKWRRAISLDVIACQDNPLPAKTVRLPKKASEGDMPQVAIAVGSVDSPECVLSRIGVDATEFTPPSKPGKVHVYAQKGATATGGFPPAETLWGSAAALHKNDLVFFACDGSAIYGDNVSTPGASTSLNAVTTFVNDGGRLFTTHFHYFWTKFGVAPTAAVFGDKLGDPTTPTLLPVPTQSPKGLAFATWLSAVGASTTPGEIVVAPTNERSTVANPNNSLVTTWLGAAKFPKILTLDTPSTAPPASQCGQVVFSDLHEPALQMSQAPLLSGCPTGALTPAELAVEYMLFELGGCL